MQVSSHAMQIVAPLAAMLRRLGTGPFIREPFEEYVQLTEQSRHYLLSCGVGMVCCQTESASCCLSTFQSTIIIDTLRFLGECSL